MLDQDAPPAVEEAETGGGVDAVREADINRTGAMLTAASTQPLWTIAIGQRSEATTARAQEGSGQGLRRDFRRPKSNRYRRGKMQPRESSASSTISSFKLRFRKLRAS
jgi:hypothetical protein